MPTPFAGKRKALLVRLIANGIAQGASAGMFALALRALLDTQGPSRAPWLLFAGLLISVLITGGLRWLERIDAERLGQSYVKHVRLCLFDHLGRIPPSRLLRIRHGNLSLRFVGDMSVLRFWASRGLARVWVAGAMIAGVLSVLAMLDLRFALAVALVLGCGAAVMRFGAGALDASVRVARKRQGRFAASINEQLLRLPMIQAYARRDAERAAVVERSRRLRNAAVSLATRSGLMIAITAVTTGLATIAVILIGSLGAQHTHGTLLAALLLVSLLATPLHRLGRVFELWRSAHVAREKIEALLRLGPMTRDAADAVRLPKGRGRIEFAQLSMPGRFGALDAVAHPGERVLIDAGRVADASALLWALPRLGDVYRGAIRIDGLEIAKASLGSLRRAVVLVSEELPLIRGSLLDNLRYRLPTATTADIERVVAACSLHDVVERLPHGLDTPLGDGGRLLTAAERWRVRWARALLGRPRILLIEDADAQSQGGNRDAFFAMLAAFPGTVLMSGRANPDWPRIFSIWRLPPPEMSGDDASPGLQHAVGHARLAVSG
jgi:ATP-binding cassette, subfamily B, bacterial